MWFPVMIKYLEGAPFFKAHIYMISVIFDESLKSFYERFGFYTMLSGQFETYESV